MPLSIFTGLISGLLTIALIIVAYMTWMESRRSSKPDLSSRAKRRASLLWFSFLVFVLLSQLPNLLLRFNIHVIASDTGSSFVLLGSVVGLACLVGYYRLTRLGHIG